MKNILTTLLLLAAGQSAVASLSCPDIRLDTSGTLASYPVFDQANESAATDMNICYASTAASLIDTYRASVKSEEQVETEVTSPWWVAVNYASAFKKDADPDVPFGEPDKALQALKSDGVCSHKDLFEDKKVEDIILFHKSLKDFFKSVGDANEERPLAAQRLSGLLEKLGFLKDPTAVAEFSGRALQEKTFVRFLRTIFHGKCQGKVKVNSPYDVERIEADRLGLSNDRKGELITQTLERSQPIEISICSQVLRNPGYVPAEDYKRCLRHSALVVGSREKNGQCQYLVRDTYGSGSCQRKRNGQPWYHPSLECQSGQVWVPREALLTNIWGMTRVVAIATPPGPAMPVGISTANAASTASSTKGSQAAAPPAAAKENTKIQ